MKFNKKIKKYNFSLGHGIFYNLKLSKKGHGEKRL